MYVCFLYRLFLLLVASLLEFNAKNLTTYEQ